MPTKVTYTPVWGEIKSGKPVDGGLLELVTDVHRRAVINAPKDTRALVNSSKINKVVGGFSVSFGSGRVPYALRRHFENKKNPQTLHYLSRAADSVLRGNLSKYFRISR